MGVFEPEHDMCISIHALLAESDVTIFAGVHDPIKFLSTLSLRRATALSQSSEKSTPISIHALLAESDFVQSMSHKYLTISIHALLAESDNGHQSKLSLYFYFYPRSPCGERPRRTYQAGSQSPFLSTLSLRRATCIIVITGNCY